MTSRPLYETDSLVYPGEYIPLLGESDFNETRRQSSKNKIKNLPVNIKELADSYKIEISIPGAKRKNLLLQIKGNILSISVLHNDVDPRYQDYQLHGFNFNRCFSHKLELPENADPVFISAEFKAGTLYLHIPKSSQPLNWINTKIAIY